MSSGLYPTLGQRAATRMPPASGLESVGFEATTTLEPVVDSEEAARFLNINPKTLQKMARNREVPAYRQALEVPHLRSGRVASFQGNLKLPLVPRKRKEMTFVYAGEIPVWEFAEEEEGQRARRLGVSVLRYRRPIPGALSGPLNSIRTRPPRARLFRRFF
jgi:hypothetical protein